jgi:hypothetical protein
MDQTCGGLTIHISPEGELVEFGEKTVYFRRKPGDMRLDGPENEHVELRGLFGRRIQRRAFASRIASFKRLADARDRFKCLRHLIAKGSLKGSFGLLVILLIWRIGHASKPNRGRPAKASWPLDSPKATAA